MRGEAPNELAKTGASACRSPRAEEGADVVMISWSSSDTDTRTVRRPCPWPGAESAGT